MENGKMETIRISATIGSMHLKSPVISHGSRKMATAREQADVNFDIQVKFSSHLLKSARSAP
jgi:hypothetical protein